MSNAAIISGAYVRLRPRRTGDIEAFWAFGQTECASMMDRSDISLHLRDGLANEAAI